MNYVFLDTCTWIDFASGKKVDGSSKFDFTKEKNQILESLEELVESKDIILLKNEIIDFEFKNAPVSPLIDSYKKNVFERFKNDFEKRIIPYCKDSQVLKELRQSLFSLDDITESFSDDCLEFNNRIMELYGSSISINVSEELKQKALSFSIFKNHNLFNNNKNNVNDFLILYSIQEWVESYPELKELDETNDKHQVYFVTKNIKDFGIKGEFFEEELGISQLIKPIRNINELISIAKLRKHNSKDFLPKYTLDGLILENTLTQTEVAIKILNQLILLKKELFLSYVNSKICNVAKTSKMKYLGSFLSSDYNQPIIGEHPIIRSQDIRDYKLNVGKLLVSDKLELTSYSQKGDLLINSLGTRVGEHCINMVETNVHVHQSIYVFRINQNVILADFIDYFLRCHKLKEYANGGFMPRLNISDLKNIGICLPSLEQQNSLVEQFRHKEKEIENDILGIKRKIKMLLK